MNPLLCYNPVQAHVPLPSSWILAASSQCGHWWEIKQQNKYHRWAIPRTTILLLKTSYELYTSQTNRENNQHVVSARRSHAGMSCDRQRMHNPNYYDDGNWPELLQRSTCPGLWLVVAEAYGGEGRRMEILGSGVWEGCADLMTDHIRIRGRHRRPPQLVRPYANPTQFCPIIVYYSLCFSI